MKALGAIDEKYLRKMLEDDASACDDALLVSSNTDPSAAGTDEISETAPDTQSEHKPVYHGIIRYLILGASAAACIGGVAFLMHHHNTDDLSGHSVPVAVTEITASLTTGTSAVHMDTATESNGTTAAVSAAGTDETTAPEQSTATDTVQISQTVTETEAALLTTTALPVTAESTTETVQTSDTIQTTEQPQTVSQQTTESTTTSEWQTVPPYPFKEPFGGTFDFVAKPDQRGTVVKEQYAGVNGENVLYVYLPYGYDPSERYDILYFVDPGYEESETDIGFAFCETDGNLSVMLDNMIANQEIEPMIVVSPTFRKCEDPVNEMWQEMRESVVPFVEGKYSTYAKSSAIEDLVEARAHRAYGGYSLGSMTVWNNMVHNLDLFKYFMPICGHSEGQVSEITDAMRKLNYQPDDFRIFTATGTEDISYSAMEKWIDALRNDPAFIETNDFANGNLIYLTYEQGVHWWGCFRKYIYNALPNFFRQT